METGKEYDDGRITFYYSREERLKKAPKAVRDINEPYIKPKPNLFRTLTATRPLTFLFISIITICAAMIFLSRFLTAEGVRTLGNNTVSVSVIGAGDASYITIKKTVPDSARQALRQTAGFEGTYNGAVDIAVSLPGEGNPIYTERIYFQPVEEEIFRFSAPLRGKKLIILMEAGRERALCTITQES